MELRITLTAYHSLYLFNSVSVSSLFIYSSSPPCLHYRQNSTLPNVVGPLPCSVICVQPIGTILTFYLSYHVTATGSKKQIENILIWMHAFFTQRKQHVSCQVIVNLSVLLFVEYMQFYDMHLIPHVYTYGLLIVRSKCVLLKMDKSCINLFFDI